MDRRDFYFRQRVKESELDDAFDGAENAIWQLAVDMGAVGIVEGGTVTENSPTDLQVIAEATFRGIQQEGKRLEFATNQTIDCEFDYLNNPTVPVTPGNKRWISIHVRFARAESDERLDGNGQTIYFVQDESFEFRIVAGAEAGGDTHTKPGLPSDALLLADVELIYGQTDILNADIDTSRQEDFVIGDADQITVDSSGWTKLDNTLNTVQEAFDDVDDRIISVDDGTFRVDQDIVPQADDTYALGSISWKWDAFIGEFYMDDLLSDIIPQATNTYDVGSPSYRLAEMHSADSFSDTFTAPPGTRAQDAFVLSSSATIYRFMPPHMASPYQNTSDQSTGWMFVRQITFGTETHDVWEADITVAETDYYLRWDFMLPDGATISSIRATVWQEVTATTELSIRGYKEAADGTRTQLGSTQVYAATFDLWKYLTISGLSEVVDNHGGNKYFLEVEGANGGGTRESAIREVRVEYTITDVGRAFGW